MATLNQRLAHVARMTLILPFLLAALLGLGLHINAASHATSASASHSMAVDDLPPSH